MHVEDETHGLLNCDKYHPIREIIFEKAVTIYPDFNILSDEEKMIFLFYISNDSSLCQSLLSNFTMPFSAIV